MIALVEPQAAWFWLGPVVGLAVLVIAYLRQAPPVIREAWVRLLGRAVGHYARCFIGVWILTYALQRPDLPVINRALAAAALWSLVPPVFEQGSS